LPILGEKPKDEGTEYQEGNEGMLSETPGRVIDLLFLTREGRPLTKEHVEKAIAYYGRKAGIIGVKCSSHTFRHTAAAKFLRNHGDVFTLQRMLGQAAILGARTALSPPSTQLLVPFLLTPKSVNAFLLSIFVELAVTQLISSPSVTACRRD